MITWEKTGRTVTAEGTTVTYTARDNRRFTIESRLRHIPHAAKGGTWDHTSYFVLIDGVQQREFQRLRDAKEYAELFLGRLTR